MPVTRSQALIRRNTFPFLELAGETRNAIYPALMDDITQPAQALSLWRDTVPNHNKMITYNALRQTCKMIDFELRSIFEAEYSPNIRLYFFNLRDVYSFAESEAGKMFKKAGCEYTLKSPIGRAPGRDSSGKYAMVGISYMDDCIWVPRDFWRQTEDFLEVGIRNAEREERWSWETGEKLTAKLSDDADYDVFCSISVRDSGMLLKSSTLVAYSRFTVGGGEEHRKGQTTVVIEGKLADMQAVRHFDDRQRHSWESKMTFWDAMTKRANAKREMESLKANYGKREA